jgi:type II secretory pathway pseudopilin PulG
VIIVVVVVVIVLVIVAAALIGSGNKSNSTQTIIASGTVYNLNAGYYESVGPVDLTSSSSWTIAGTFTASNGITVYVLTSSQYAAWGQSGSPSSYYWTSGADVVSGAFNTNLPSGTYYFIWINPNLTLTTSVDITSAVTATP